MGVQPVNFTRTYDEALSMIVEARNYMWHIEPHARRNAEGMPNLRFSCEALRVTSRLTQVMAWLMMQRAVQDGEITQEEAMSDSNRLAGQEVCLDTAAAEDEGLPSGLRDLLARSYRLYTRISRLEQMVRDRLH